MRRRLTSLVLLALLVRAMVPAGFMLVPVQADSAGFTVVICTDHGEQALVLDDDGHPRQSNPQASHDSCPFAVSALPGLVSEPIQPSVNVEYAAATYTVAPLLFRPTPNGGATSARGPPGLV